MTATVYDTIIIGSGQAGTPLAGFLAGKGKKVLLAEKNKLGGTCVNTGCTPSKTLHEAVRKIYYARNMADRGFHSGGELDFTRLMQYVRAQTEVSRKNIAGNFNEMPELTVLYGEAVFTGNKEIEIRLHDGGLHRATAKSIYINTGSRPALPDITGLDKVPYKTNLNIFDITALPAELIIIGGGFIGTEFAQTFARLGSKVTLLHHGKRILSTEDDDIADQLEKILRREGVQIVTDFSAAAVEETQGKYTLRNDAGKHYRADEILITTGRHPNTRDLGLENTGIQTDEKGFIKVNDKLETSVEGVFAMGEVAGSAMFTHISYDDFRVVRNNLEEKSTSTSGRKYPYTLFTDPQLGRFGLNEKQAKSENQDYDLYTLPAESFARAREKGEPHGLVKVLAEKESGKILGVSALISEGGELMSLLQVAASGNLTVKDLKEMIFAHPLLAEGLNSIFS